jgi:hypothetical protein
MPGISINAATTPAGVGGFVMNRFRGYRPDKSGLNPRLISAIPSGSKHFTVFLRGKKSTGSLLEMSLNIHVFFDANHQKNHMNPLDEFTSVIQC